MKNNSIEQLGRMLSLINHKQVINKANVEEAINKAVKSKILLKESEDFFSDDFTMHDSETEKELNKNIGSGSDPKFAGNELSSSTGGDRDFDMPYRMWLLKYPSKIIELKVNSYNEKNPGKPIEFNFSNDTKKSWIEKPYKTKIGSGTLGISGNLEKIGKYILEFMVRIYSGKLSAAEQKFQKDCGDNVFQTTYTVELAKNFLESFLNQKVAPKVFTYVKAQFNDEINERILLQAKDKAIDYILIETKEIYDTRKPNYFGWASTIMKNQIINVFRRFGDTKLTGLQDIADYVKTLEYPYFVKTNAAFANQIRGTFGVSSKKNLNDVQWEDYKENTNTQFDGIPALSNDFMFIFKYETSDALLSDITSSKKHGEKISPVSFNYISTDTNGGKSLKQFIYSSELKPSGEEKFQDMQTTVIDGVKIKFSKSMLNKDKEFDITNDSNAIQYEFPKGWDKNKVVSWAQANKNRFSKYYNDKTDYEDAIHRSMGHSFGVGESPEKESGNFNYKLFDSRISKIKQIINRYYASLEKSKKQGNEEAIIKYTNWIEKMQERLDILSNLTVSYTSPYKFSKRTDSLQPETGKEVDIVSIVDANGEDVKVNDETMQDIKSKATEEINKSYEEKSIEPLINGSEEQEDFDRSDREERIKKIMETGKFINAFLKTIQKTKPNLFSDLVGFTGNKIKKSILNNKNASEATPEEKAVAKEYYAFLGDMIAEIILNVPKSGQKPLGRGATEKGSDFQKTFQKTKDGEEIPQGNISNIYDALSEKYINKLSGVIGEERAKNLFTLTNDNLDKLAAAVSTFMYEVSSKDKKEIFSDMELNEQIENIRKLIREHLVQEFGTEFQADLDEERISNEDGGSKVNEKHNFIGSQVFGEDLGDVGKSSNWKEGLYGVFSYGEQFPIYIYTNISFHDQDGNLKNRDGKFRWFNNIEEYMFDIDKDGQKEPMASVQKHKELLKPNSVTHGLTTATLLDIIKSFKAKHKIKDLSHVSILPGEGAGIHYGDDDKEHDKRKNR